MTLWPTKAPVSWISQETWRLVDRQTELQQAQRASMRDIIQARQEFQRSLRGDIQPHVKEAGEEIEALLAADHKQGVWKRISSWYIQSTGGQYLPPRKHLDSIATERE